MFYQIKLINLSPPGGENEYQYSGSEDEKDDNPTVEGEGPSSIQQAPGNSTLRRDFQKIQEGNRLVREFENFYYLFTIAMFMYV